MARLKMEWTPSSLDLEGEPSVVATWGDLRILLSDLSSSGRSVVLTRVDDHRAKSTRDSVSLPVAALAEWLVRNWFLLFRSDRTAPEPDAPRSARYAWSRSHDLRFVGDGLLLPALEFAPVSEDTLQLTWRPDDSPHAETEPISFITPCMAPVLIARKDVQDSLREFVDTVLRRLQQAAPDAELTQSLDAAWRSVHDIRGPDYRGRVLAARLGLRWVDLTETQRQRFREFGDLPKEEQELLAAASLESLDAAVAFLEDRRRECAAAPSAPEWLRERVLQLRAAPIRSDRPWLRGWMAARELRRAWGWRDDEPQFDPADLEFDVVEAGQTPVDCESVVAWDQGRVPVRWLGAGRTDSTFKRTRDLYPFFFDGPLHGGYSRCFAPQLAGVHSIANAFAAELIAPMAAIQKRLPRSRRITAEDIAQIADEIGAPQLCVEHQVRNRLDLRA